jgi:predicted lipid-binding transport protein (Tim44 family)
MTSGLNYAAGGLSLGSGIFSGISAYQQAKRQAGLIKQSGAMDAQQVLDEGEQLRQQQKSIASAGGFVLNEDSSPLLLMVETENRAREQAERIKALAAAQAKAAKKAGRDSLIGGILGGAAGGALAGLRFAIEN